MDLSKSNDLKNCLSLLSTDLGVSVFAVQSLGNAAGSNTFRIELQGQAFIFLKTYHHSNASLQMKAEISGLQAISATNTLSTPKVLWQRAKGADEAALALEWIISAPRLAKGWADLGAGLANLHKQTQSFNFGWSINNWIGSLSQINTPHIDWHSFYLDCRLIPQIEATKSNYPLPKELYAALDQVLSIMEHRVPQESPALIHGDLWSGNILSDATSSIYLIDPAVSYSHREMDLAMMELFGGSHPLFWDAYRSVYPLEDGWNDRVGWYQLYYLLVHVNLFGTGYTRPIQTRVEQLLKLA